MPWSEPAFDRLRAEVRASLDGGRTPGGVPFFVFVYDPSEEVRCLRSFERWAAALEGEQTAVTVVYLGRLLAEILETDTLYLSEEGRDAEQSSRQEVARELARAESLPRLLTAALLEGREDVCPPLRDGSEAECVFLLRAGALFPFVHVSQILNGLETRTMRTVVIPFPGACDPERADTLRFLAETEGTYYRARIIGC